MKSYSNRRVVTLTALVQLSPSTHWYQTDCDLCSQDRVYSECRTWNSPLSLKKTGSNGTFGEAFLSELKNNGIWDARLPLNHPFWGWWCSFSRYTVACRLSVCLSVTPFSNYPRCEPNYFSHNRQKKSLFLSFLPDFFSITSCTNSSNLG